MLIFIGLGNPVFKYAGTRHNIGAEMLYEFSEQYLGVSSLVKSSFCNALEASGFCELFDKKVFCFFPQTYMNLSGDCVQKIITYFKISLEQICVFHDETELLPKDVYYKFGGGHKGHNGIRDIQSKCGSADFHRIRIGVGRPEYREDLANYVLSMSPKNDIPDLKQIVDLIQKKFLN